jgi:serine/threonine protein kinase
MIGKTVSHYNIIEKLGEGGMGEVYLAEDLKLERKVAIKFLPQHFTKDKENVERFEREAKAAASLNHPNIVTIHEIAKYDDQTFIVMEYVEGNTLRDILITSSKFPVPNSSDIITQISEGLSKAHQAGIVHRDIKPENIIIDKDGRVKILDFGLAKLKGVSKLTKETSTLGTIHYMSPEQIQGQEVDHRSDIWSFGVVLYEMLTGEVPFSGDYEQAIIYAILNSNPLEEERAQSTIPQAMNQLLQCMLQKNPQQRYASINQFLMDLKNCKENQTVGVKSRKLKLLRFWLPVSFLLLIIISVFLYWQHTDTATIAKSDPVQSVAVLPFVNMSDQKENEYLLYYLLSI